MRVRVSGRVGVGVRVGVRVGWQAAALSQRGKKVIHAVVLVDQAARRELRVEVRARRLGHVGVDLG